MRLYLLAGGLLALSGLFLATRPTHGCCGAPGSPTPAAPTGDRGGHRAVAEMVAILDKTDSKDTLPPGRDDPPQHGG